MCDRTTLLIALVRSSDHSHYWHTFFVVPNALTPEQDRDSEQVQDNLRSLKQ